jgi:hypothetical protein
LHRCIVMCGIVRVVCSIEVVLCLFLDSITCGSRSGIGHTMLVPVNHTSRDNITTSFKPSLGQRRTTSKLSSISTVPLEVKMGTRSRTVFPFNSYFLTAFSNFSFDNSGQRLSFPQWQSKQANVDRTNAIIRSLAYEFRYQSQVVSVISPLNECAQSNSSLITG